MRSQLQVLAKNAFKNIDQSARITIYARNKNTYKKAVQMMKKAGAKKATFKFKRKVNF